MLFVEDFQIRIDCYTHFIQMWNANANKREEKREEMREEMREEKINTINLEDNKIITSIKPIKVTENVYYFNK